jgi:hypothetical protein
MQQIKKCNYLFHLFQVPCLVRVRRKISMSVVSLFVSMKRWRYFYRNYRNVMRIIVIHSRTTCRLIPRRRTNLSEFVGVLFSFGEQHLPPSTSVLCCIGVRVAIFRLNEEIVKCTADLPAPCISFDTFYALFNSNATEASSILVQHASFSQYCLLSAFLSFSR